MNFDPKITERLKAFVALPDAEKDYADGAELLMRITGNMVRFREMMRKGPQNFAWLINKQLSSHLEFRLAKLTHDQVREMKVKADAIVEQSGKKEEKVKAGRRADHDSLPPEIQAAYTETLDCLRKQRELHLQIRKLALGSATCPDSELYPFVKEIIALDTKRLSLWKKYDEYKPSDD